MTNSSERHQLMTKTQDVPIHLGVPSGQLVGQRVQMPLLLRPLPQDVDQVFGNAGE